jgi:hypothetical protein
MGLPSWPPHPRPQTFHRLATRCNLLTSGTADADDVEDGDMIPDMTSWGYRLLALEPHRLDKAFGDALSHHFTPGLFSWGLPLPCSMAWAVLWRRFASRCRRGSGLG